MPVVTSLVESLRARPRLMKIRQILGDPKADPPIEPLIPIKEITWRKGVSSGRYPRGVLHGRSRFWSSEEIADLIEREFSADTAAEPRRKLQGEQMAAQRAQQKAQRNTPQRISRKNKAAASPAT